MLSVRLFAVCVGIIATSDVVLSLCLEHANTPSICVLTAYSSPVYFRSLLHVFGSLWKCRITLCSRTSSINNTEFCVLDAQEILQAVIPQTNLPQCSKTIYYNPSLNLHLLDIYMSENIPPRTQSTDHLSDL